MPAPIGVEDYRLSATDRDYDVSAEGERFLMVRSGEATRQAKLIVVLNWHEGLERLAPTRP